jgi:hypothetical protein
MLIFDAALRAPRRLPFGIDLLMLAAKDIDISATGRVWRCPLKLSLS